MNFICKITRPDIDDHSLFGFVLESSDTLTLIAEEDDFCLDGYKVLRNCDIDIRKPTASTRYCTRIMKKEGLLDNIDDPPQVDLSSWAALFSSLRRQDRFVIVEDEVRGQFLIGPIRRVNKKSVTINYFDGTGNWLGPENITYDEITCVSFGSRYIRMHRKYIKSE